MTGFWGGVGGPARPAGRTVAGRHATGLLLTGRPGSKLGDSATGRARQTARVSVLFEPALPLGVDEPPAVFDKFAPGVSLGARDGQMGLKLGVNRLVVEDDGVGALVWLASGVGERMDRGGHPPSPTRLLGAGSLVRWRPGALWSSPCGRQRWQRMVDEPLTDWTRRPGFVEPCLPSPAERPPSGPGWIHEIKHDGFRLMARRDVAGVRLLTRNGLDWSSRYPAHLGRKK